MVGELRAKQIVHLHRLLGLVADEFCEQGMSERRLSEYRDRGVGPTDFKATKADHEAALVELAEAVSGWAAEQLHRADDGDDDARRVERPIES